MIETNAIRDAVNARLVQLWPERTVYVDVCPVDFARPSSWLHVTRDERVRANAFLIRRTVGLSITLYDQQDDHYEASWSRLAGDADRMLTALLPPLRVGERCFLINWTALPREPDRETVTGTFTFTETVPLREDGGEELMETLEARVELRE